MTNGSDPIPVGEGDGLEKLQEDIEALKRKFLGIDSVVVYSEKGGVLVFSGSGFQEIQISSSRGMEFAAARRPGGPVFGIKFPAGWLP